MQKKKKVLTAKPKLRIEITSLIILNLQAIPYFLKLCLYDLRTKNIPTRCQMLRSCQYLFLSERRHKFPGCDIIAKVAVADTVNR